MKTRKRIKDHSPLKFTIMQDNFWKYAKGESTCIGPVLMIAWSYDPEASRQIRGTLHKIGDPQFVERWANEVARKIASMPVNPFGYIGTLIFKVHEIDVERLNEINKMHGITGYIGTWLEREGIIQQVIARYQENQNVS